jgi:hypothetical protein
MPGTNHSAYLRIKSSVPVRGEENTGWLVLRGGNLIFFSSVFNTFANS